MITGRIPGNPHRQGHLHGRIVQIAPVFTEVFPVIGEQKHSGAIL
jgi:hypothetical protein